MRFDFDAQKDRANLKKHGVDFEEAQRLWERTHVIIPTKNVKNENRSAILGAIQGKIYIGIFTEREGMVRIISCHRADKKWEKIFYEYLKKTET